MYADTGFKVKRQDGKPIEPAKIEEIKKGVSEIESVFGSQKDVFQQTGITISHTNGKHPFLEGSAAGLYSVDERTIVMGHKLIGLIDSPSLAHEWAHWLDFESGKRVGAENSKTIGEKRVKFTSLAEADQTGLLTTARGTMTKDYEVKKLINLPKEELAKLPEEQRYTVERMKASMGPYWRDPREIWARLVEQYIGEKMGQKTVSADSPEYYTDTPAYWSQKAFDRLKPMVEAEVNRRLGILRGGAETESRRVVFGDLNPGGFGSQPHMDARIGFTDWRPSVDIQKMEDGTWALTDRVWKRESKSMETVIHQSDIPTLEEAKKAASTYLNTALDEKAAKQAGTLSQPRTKTKVQAGQSDMFSTGASDLPLFSGVPMAAKDQTFNPQAESGQLSMFPDMVPQEAPKRIIELAIKDQGFTSYTRMDMTSTKKIKQTLDMHPDSAITYRVLDARGKVLSSGTDAREVISPTIGKPGTLFESRPQPMQPADRPETALPADWDAYVKELEAKTAKLGVDAKLNVKLYGGTQFDKAVNDAPHKIYFDVAGLKAINDAYGHAAGDQLLHAVVKVSDAMGADLHRANSAGDEFVIPLNSEAEAEQFKKTLRKKLNEQIIIFTGKDGQQHTATGLDAHIGSGATVSAADLAARADTIQGYERGGLPPAWRESTAAGTEVSGLQYTESYSGDRTGRPGIPNTGSEAQGSGNNAGEVWQHTRGSIDETGQSAADTWKNTRAAVGNPLNSTPTTAPDAQAVQELNIDTARPMLKRMQTEYKARMNAKPTTLQGAQPETIDALRQYMKDTRSDMASTKMTAMRYGQSLRDYAMLNYSQRYGADDILNVLFPYQFWYTRSMLNWGRRAVDAPQWFSMYARLQQVQDKMQHAGVPTRLAGKWRVPMPWLDQWTGGGMWTDPYKNLMSFGQFLDPFDKQKQNQAQIDKRAEYNINQMVTDGTITANDRQMAVSTHQGDIWEKASKQAAAELDISNGPMDMVAMMQTPALWYTIPKAIMDGKADTISPLPMTTFGQTVRTLGKGTFAQPATDLVGGALAGPEEAIRKATGLSVYGQYGEYYIDRALANMAAEPNSQFTPDAINRAMIERSGPIYDEAIRRIDEELALRTPGAASIMAAKKGNVAGALTAAATIPAGGGALYPQGEQIQRDNKLAYDNAWAKYDNGDKNAINDFFKEYPEYTLRNAMNDTPEGRLRNFLIENVFDKYNALDRADKAKAREVMGDNFSDMYNKDLRKGMDINQLAQWAQTLGTKLPKTPLIQEQPAQTPQYYDPTLGKAITNYQNERDQKFPMYYPLQTEYYALPAGAERKAYIKQFPQLKQYWDWKAQQSTDHPELKPYFDELKTASQQATLEPAMNEITSPLLRQLMDYSAGGSLTPGAQAEMRRIWQQNAPEMTYQEYLDLISKTIFSSGKSTLK